MAAPAWLDELDLHAGTPEAAMSTRALDDSRWLCIDDEWLGQRDASRRLLADRRTEVLAGSVPAAATELGERIDDWLAAHHPAVVDDAHRTDADPMAAAAMRVAEDLCLLTPGDDGWVLAAGCVCFPSYWRLRDKVGRPLGDVHEPVPGYPGPLATRVDGFLGRLRPGQGVWRRNWSIHDDADLYLPEHRSVARTAPAPAGLWLRSEYQTLLRLVDADAVVFTIRTQQVPLAVLADRPDVRTAMAAAVRGWTPGQRSYKGAAVDEDVVRWLESAAGCT